MNAAALNSADSFYRKGTCPIHDGGFREKVPTTSFSRSKSVDCGYVRPDAMMVKRGAGPWEMPSDSLLRGRKPFQHSHSVTCAVPSSSQAAAVAPKAKSVGNLSGTQRPLRPNVLELCPNQNTVFDAYRRRYSRSSERSLDFEDYCLHEYGTLSGSRFSRRRSSSKDSGRAYSVLFRHDAEAQEKKGSIKKGKSLLSLCTGLDDDSDEDEYRSSKILRPPTRHFYQKGMSGLPVKCPAKYMGLAY